ncbi:class I SAM-dependent methyltransferase [bacterium]|nr:class I SAM-dependent methyltransferase [bacterium]
MLSTTQQNCLDMTPYAGQVEMHPIRNRKEFEAYFQKVASSRMALEAQIAQSGKDRLQWLVSGYCEVCETKGLFVMDWQYSDQQTPNFRERLLCTRCKMNNRQRFALRFLKEEVRLSGHEDFVIYLYEQVTPFYRFVKNHFKDIRIIGSEYFGFEYTSGRIIKGIRHEDAMALSFPDASIDIIMSNDVYEHVPQYIQALAEAGRVIKPGGKLIFSIPFYAAREQSELRAVLENGEVKHLLPEQYHGNPFLVKGSLVFNDFGWDVLEACRQNGFDDAYALAYYSPYHGYVGNGGQIVFVAQKKSGLLQKGTA